MTPSPTENDPYPALSAEVRALLADDHARSLADTDHLIDLLEAERERVATLEAQLALTQSSRWQLQQLRRRAASGLTRGFRRQQAER